MDHLIDWGTSVGGIITTVTSVIVVYFSWILIKLTNRPEILVDLYWKQLERGEWGQVYSIFIYAKNDGKGVAHKIKFKKDPSFQAFGDCDFEGRAFRSCALEEIDFLNDGIDTLASKDVVHEEVAVVDRDLFHFVKNLLIQKDRRTKEDWQTEITVTYQGSMRRKYGDDFPLDFGKRKDNAPFE